MPETKRLYDIAPLPGMPPEIGTLAATLVDGTREWREELESVSEEAVCWQPFPDGHSIGGLILHIAEVEAWWFEEVAMGKPLSPEELAELRSADIEQYAIRWPKLEPQPVDELFALHDRIRRRSLETLKAFTDVAGRRTREKWDYEVTLRWILAHVVEHESYHGGQAVLLKLLHEKAQRA